MQVRSGISLWQALGPPPVETPPLADDVNCDVAIVGGGVTGALVAYLMLAEGVDVVLLDKAVPAVGSTAASTGLLQYEVDTPLVDLIRKRGEAAAVHAYRRGVTAIGEIEQLVAELGQPCGFSRRSSVYLASHFWHRRRLRREYECRREHGFRVDYVDAGSVGRQLPGNQRGRPAIRSYDDAQIDPYRFSYHLLERCRRGGMRIFSHSKVDEVHEDAAGVSLRTSGGTVRANRVVFATGYDSSRFLPRQVGSLSSTYAVASEPRSFADWPGGELIWETARPYFYARQTDDGRAIIGGGDTPFSTDHQRDGLMEKKRAWLQKRFDSLFPQKAFVPAFAWAGTFGATPDGLPFIGPPAGRPRSYFALGYGGNGITFGMIAARLLADLHVGRQNADAGVFRFDR